MGSEVEGDGREERAGSSGRMMAEVRDAARGKHDEGFTAAVMLAGLRNFGISELAEESYLNEAG